ncbi:MAG: hypothetical protein R3F55_13000 [Alphaproteobacteria bacterium]
MAKLTTLGTVAILVAGVVSGCGANPADRAVSGAALGAGTAAAGAAVVDGNVGAAALVGGLLGGGAGLLTDPGQVNFGEPFWRQ